LVWPAALAPYAVHIAALGCPEPADQVYQLLEQAGLDVLLDDRNERAGVQFHDADLIGIPIRLTVSERSLKQGGVELKLRAGEEKKIIPLDALPEAVQAEWRARSAAGAGR